MQQPVHLTPEGVERLKEELARLTNERRPALAERLRKAIQQGDLSENADYTAAKEEQGFLEGRIQQIEAMLRNYELITGDGPPDEVRVGARVTVVEDGVDEEEVYHLVGPIEADPAVGRISYESPIGQALMGHKVGDRVRVDAPAGEIVFQVVALG